MKDENIDKKYFSAQLALYFIKNMRYDKRRKFKEERLMKNAFVFAAGYFYYYFYFMFHKVRVILAAENGVYA